MTEMCGTNIIVIVLLCVVLSPSSAIDGEDKLIKHKNVPASPLVFPSKSAPSTPILEGDNPAQSNLPPKVFPSASPEHNTSGPPILSGTVDEISEIKTHHDLLVNATQKVESTTKFTGEQADMLHNKYTGGLDVDEIWNTTKKPNEKEEKKPSEKEEKKPSEKDEKKPTFVKKDPKSEVEVDPVFDKKGPKMMNETKTKPADSVLTSTSKMMAMSSSVLSTTQKKHHGLIEPAKTVATVLLSVVVVLCLGFIGLLIWKRIAMRRFGRDVLINEDDFDEVSDMHTFERAQIQIT
ncbi:uncharacterized protein LOC124358930 [Homalodisca vitripennis]|uniref:uncharacterized protein LOC124358930 n=1 Tax=Homalodisca vitripennis TaxID=197043 RepID=UPI001EEAF1C1|nr:uncharacterized protein LOC124358930 [Homalodisca vitripennis]